MEVVIIGAGAVGLSSAYYLAKGGARVRVLTNESEGNHDGASYGNAGMIVPSSFHSISSSGCDRGWTQMDVQEEKPFQHKGFRRSGPLEMALGIYQVLNSEES